MTDTPPTGRAVAAATAAQAATTTARHTLPAPHGATPARRPASMLASVIRGRVELPPRILIYGENGIGKTSWASDAPAPIFIPCESGTDQLDVPRFPEPKSWADVVRCIDELIEDKHDYKTLVIDTVDRLELLIHPELLSNYRDTNSGRTYRNVDEIPFRNGYTAELPWWRSLCASLERLRERRHMGVVLIGHAKLHNAPNPQGEDYQRYTLKIGKEGGSLLREWCDDVLYASYETFTHDAKSGRAKGVSNGTRVLHTQRHAVYDAKTRHALPPSLPLDYAAYAAAVLAHEPRDPGALQADIDAALTRATATPELAARVRSAVAAANGNASQLARILDRLTATLGIAAAAAAYDTETQPSPPTSEETPS